MLNSIAGQPVGIFDSGVGGLSVLRAIRQELPAENLIYAGDSGFAPYGDRSHEFVQNRAVALTEFLIDQGSKAVVVACNTATGIAVDALRSRFDIPIVAIEPAVKPAAALTRSGVIGVLATTGTIASENLTRLVSRYGRDVEVLVQASPGLADQVEKGELSNAKTRSLIEEYVGPLKQKGADVLVLGCTHYPFLAPLIKEVAGPGLELIDPASAVARELRRRLEVNGLLSPSTARGSETFWTTGDPREVQPVMAQLWTSAVEVRALVHS